jgi:hypothetical protein
MEGDFTAIISDEQIDLSVVVTIEGLGGAMCSVSKSCLGKHIVKSLVDPILRWAVHVESISEIGNSHEKIRRAVSGDIADLDLLHAARNPQFQVPRNRLKGSSFRLVIKFQRVISTSDEKVGSPISVMIDPSSGQGISKGKHALLDCHIGKFPLSIILEKGIWQAVTACDIEVKVSVAVKVCRVKSISRVDESMAIDGNRASFASKFAHASAALINDFWVRLGIEVSDREWPHEFPGLRSEVD